MESIVDVLGFIVDTLSSIDTVIKDWDMVDRESRTHFLYRVEKLKKWKSVLEKWKGDFVTTKPEKRSALILQLQDIMADVRR